MIFVVVLASVFTRDLSGCGHYAQKLQNKNISKGHIEVMSVSEW